MMNNNKHKVLAIAAHPDDEILGCGGTIAKHIINGDSVHVIIMAEGITSRDNVRNVVARENELLNLHSNTKLASSILGVKNVELYDFPDNRMDSLNLLDIVKKLKV